MIVLREHERISVADHWNSNLRTIGRKQLEMLLYHQERNGIVLFQPGFRCLKATSWVGTLGLGQHCLDVIPKIDGGEGQLDEKETRTNLLWMASKAGLIPIADADIAPLAHSPRTLLAAFLLLYVQKLSVEWRRGPIRQYMINEDSRPFLRGKLLFSEQLRRNLFHKHRFYTRTNEFITDNILSALLKAALQICVQQTFSMEVAREAKRLLIDFAEVQDLEFTHADLDQIQVSRQHQRFEMLIRLAKMIIDTSSPGKSDQATPIYSLMFDMNVVFERFVASLLHKAVAGTDLTVRVQLKGRCLLQKEGKPKFHLKPDVGIYRGENLYCLIDTKWKRLDRQHIHNGVSQADMYQMYAYGKEFNAPLAILLYPRWGNLPEKVSVYNHSPKLSEPARYIEIATLAISHANGTLASELRLKNDLIRLIRNCLPGEISGKLH